MEESCGWMNAAAVCRKMRFRGADCNPIVGETDSGRVQPDAAGKADGGFRLNQGIGTSK